MSAMSNNHYSELSSDYESVLDRDDEYDVIIEVGRPPDITKFRAHSFVLRVRCIYFKKAFQETWSEKTDNGCYIFKKPNISASVFQVILRYLYTGDIHYKDCDADTLVRCLVAADELCLLKFAAHVEDYLCSHPDIFKTEAVAVLEVIHKIESTKRLTDCCLEMISATPGILLSSERFSELDLPFMKKILEREDLKMSMNDRWDLLIRWVIVHCLIGKPDCVRTWEERQTETKAVIEELIPLIGIYDMSPVDFNTKVLPYVELLPSDLITSVLDHQVKPLAELPKGYQRARRPEPNSVLMQPDVFNLFTKWIQSTNTSFQHSSFKFHLLFRGSRDRFAAAAFHKCCDYKGATIVVSKIKNSELLIGGYNPLAWTSSDRAIITTESFIFTLNPNDMTSPKFSRIKNDCAHGAMYDHHNCGPIFGRSCDLLLNEGNDSNSNSAVGEYHPPINEIAIQQYSHSSQNNFNVSLPFQIQECEVFQIVRTA